MKEIWKDVRGFEGLYKISSAGRVWSVPRKDGLGRNVGGKLLKARTNNRGYWVVRLYQNGIERGFYLHRLVAIAFIDNPKGLKEINHMDENKRNNKVSNLEWCTRQYNNTYGSMTIKKQKKVKQYSLNRRFIAEHESISKAHKTTGASVTHIGAVCRGERKSCGGYKWEYAL